MKRKYRVIKEKYYKYYIAQYRLPFIPIWFNILANKTSLGLHEWHRDEIEAQETCIEHSQGIKYKLVELKPEFPKYLGWM